MFDRILRNGSIIDGTGERMYQADIGIKGDEIAAIGDLSQCSDAESIDAGGKIVTPGFIDIHTHSDAVLVADGGADSQLMQGVTTELGGQCGYSFAPVADKASIKKWMMGTLPDTEVTWSSFGGYLDTLSERRLGVNFLALVGHGALRRVVMGDERRAIRHDEVSTMRRILQQSLEEGAWGMSTGLEYWPGLDAVTDELVELCSVVEQYDGLYATHVRNRDRFYDLGFDEAIAVGRVAGVRTQISHIQPKYGRPDHAMAHALSMIDHARSVGVDIACDVIPHDWAHTSVVAMLPAWVREGGIDQFLKNISDQECRRKIKDSLAPMWRLLMDGHWDKVYFLRARNRDVVGRSMANLLENHEGDAWDLVFDLLLEEGPDALHMLWTSQSFFQNDIDLALQKDYCAVMSDTLAVGLHGPTADLIGSLSGFDWTIRFLKDYVLGKKLMTLEEGVRRITGLPADRIGIQNRGYLRAGMKADLVVLDLSSIAHSSSIAVPKKHPDGICHVIVNGQIAVRDSIRSKSFSGTVLRRGA